MKSRLDDSLDGRRKKVGPLNCTPKTLSNIQSKILIEMFFLFSVHKNMLLTSFG